MRPHLESGDSVTETTDSPAKYEGRTESHEQQFFVK